MGSDSGCVFCRIISGDIPSHRILENDHVVAFLDAAPLAPGHVLVAPREHQSTLDALPADRAAALGAALPALVGAVRSLPGVTGVNLLQNNGRSAGQVVDHVHVHVIPRVEGDGLGYRWRAGKYGDGEAQAMRDKLVALQRA